MNRVARAYAEALHDVTPRVREEPAPADEMAWQAAWFSGAFGCEFRTTDGDDVRIENFGEWNREAGPDFVRATVKVGDRVLHGAIEIDLKAGGWEQHGHGQNPDYENVVLHVVVHHATKRHFPRTAAHREIAQIFLDENAAQPANDAPLVVSRPGRCCAPLRDLPDAQLLELVTAAASRRLARKASLLHAMAGARGADHALFEALAVALGYKNNKLPFQILAQRVPRKVAATPRGEALLFGLAGFLEQPEPPSPVARREISALWRNWWRMRAGFTILPRRSWKLSGLRPANHPLRRLGALATVARHWKKVRPALESGDHQHVARVLGALQHPFWSYHTGWNSPARRRPLALIGPDRIRDIFVNVCLPWSWPDINDAVWQDWPAGAPSAPLRAVQARLFGDSPPRLPRKLHVQQGLLQIYADFCLHEEGDCARCAFPRLVGRLTA